MLAARPLLAVTDLQGDGMSNGCAVSGQGKWAVAGKEEGGSQACGEHSHEWAGAQGKQVVGVRLGSLCPYLKTESLCRMLHTGL